MSNHIQGYSRDLADRCPLSELHKASYETTSSEKEPRGVTSYMVGPERDAKSILVNLWSSDGGDKRSGSLSESCPKDGMPGQKMGLQI